jgi:RNA polymerase sigma factor (sigma-70 family)
MESDASPLVEDRFFEAAAAPSSFEAVYTDEFGDLVRLAAAVTGSAAVAEDVVQDAFAHLYGRFGAVDEPRAYVRRSVVNGCVSRFRKHRREDLVAVHGEGPAMAGGVDASDRLDLEARLDALTARQRAVVVLRIQYGLPESEVAGLLGCRPGTVGSLLHRALAALRIQMEEGR